MFTQIHTPRLVATLVALVAVSLAAPTMARPPSRHRRRRPAM